MKSYKYKLRPSARIIAIFEAWLAICCELFNAAVQERHDAYRIAGKSVGYFEQCAELPGVKADRKDVARINSQVLQNVLKRVDLAFDNFFRRVKKGEKSGYPRYRFQLTYKSFTFPQPGKSFRLIRNKLHLSRIGKVKVHLSRPIEGRNNASESSQRGVARLYGRQTFGDEFFNLPIEVIAELLVQFLLDLAAAKERAQP